MTGWLTARNVLAAVALVAIGFVFYTLFMIGVGS